MTSPRTGLRRSSAAVAAVPQERHYHYTRGSVRGGSRTQVELPDKQHSISSRNGERDELDGDREEKMAGVERNSYADDVVNDGGGGGVDNDDAANNDDNNEGNDVLDTIADSEENTDFMAEDSESDGEDEVVNDGNSRKDSMMQGEHTHSFTRSMENLESNRAETSISGHESAFVRIQETKKSQTSAFGSQSLPSRRPSGKSILKRMTIGLPILFQSINSSYMYTTRMNPKRVLTKPTEAVSNDGKDNINDDLLLCVDDILCASNGRRFVLSRYENALV